MFRSLTVWSAGAVVLALGWAVAGSASADDETTLRLGGKGEDAEVQSTYYRGGFYGGYRGGYWGGGYRGGYWGGGYRGGYWGGGYRGGYWGGGYWGGGYRAGYWGGGGYWGGYRPSFGVAYYSGFYPSYYSYPTYSYYISPCADDAATPTPTVTLSRPNVPVQLGDVTFPYDGGPAPVFVPGAAPQPKRPAVRDGLLVSAPASTSQYQFPAFGERPADVAPAPAPRRDVMTVSMPAGFDAGTTVYVSIRK